MAILQASEDIQEIAKQKSCSIDGHQCCRRFFGREIREVSADTKENDKKCCLLQVAKNQALYRNPYLKVAGI
jgi:hypothetical protein